MDDVNILSIEIIDFLIYRKLLLARMFFLFKKRKKKAEMNIQPFMILQ